MPYFDFKCEECNNIEEFLVLPREVSRGKYSLPDCKCGLHKWKKQISIGHSKIRSISEDERGVESLIGRGWY